MRFVDLGDLTVRLRAFATERDWHQFHTPKNLVIAMSIEFGELLEHLQWRTDDQIADFASTPEGRAAVADELADVLIYLIRLADVLGVDLSVATPAKIESNEARYPADLVRGSAAKQGRASAGTNALE